MTTDVQVRIGRVVVDAGVDRSRIADAIEAALADRLAAALPHDAAAVARHVARQTAAQLAARLTPSTGTSA